MKFFSYSKGMIRTPGKKYGCGLKRCANTSVPFFKYDTSCNSESKEDDHIIEINESDIKNSEVDIAKNDEIEFQLQYNQTPKEYR